MSNIIVLGIAGGSGSGKTTLMKNLIARFQDDVTVFSHDNYYRPYDELTIEERRKLNYDHPDAFDTDMMIGHLKELKAGHSIECPVYDYATYSRTSETVTVEPRKVILVEGILIFENHALCDQMDIKIFVDTDADVRLIRRIRRDVAPRTDVRIFGKPSARVNRRMGIVVGYAPLGDDLDALRGRVKAAAAEIKVLEP